MSSEAHSSGNQDRDDILKILIATDIHLGYEHTRRRGPELDDSFDTFEEILQYGKEHEVDFVLLGGDLFHDTRPSQTAILKCMNLLRKYCLGPRENKIQFLSDPEVIFRHCSYKTVNYEDPNLNVSMPVFSIHGNHDDPSFGAVGSMDVLSVTGLVNYFGKWTDLTQVTIPPLVIKKGDTYVSLYGLSYINDQRLSRLFRDYKVDMLRPEEIPECFNIFVLHQNRVKHGEYAYIPENKLPSFLNLIIWGHEHECRITPEFVTETEYFISQPGSSIATSLCEGEAKPKHVGILSIRKLHFKLKKLKLKTVRPFVFDNLILRNQDIQRDYARPLSDSVYNFVDNHIENVLIRKAAEQLTGHPKQPLEPLIRLRIFYTKDEEMFDKIKLAQKYCDEVANPMDIVIFRKDRVLNEKSKSGSQGGADDFDDMAQIFNYDTSDEDWSLTVEGGIKKYFNSEENREKLTVLTVNGLNEALNRYVVRGDGDAFKDIVKHQVKKTIAHLATCNVSTTESICEEIKSYRNKRLQKKQEEEEEMLEVLGNAQRKVQKSPEKVLQKAIDDMSGSDEDEQDMNKLPVGKGRGRGAGRGSTARGSRRGRGKSTKDDEKHATNSKISSKPISRAKKPTQKQDQSTLKNYMGTSLRQAKPAAANIFIVDDSD